MSKSTVVANWKMNKNVSKSIEFLNIFLPKIKDIKNTEIVICPSFVSLPKMSEILTDESAILGAQNINQETEGSFTGEVCAKMIKDFANYVILGHSDRRKYFGETDEMIKEKILKASEYDIMPILCIGEDLSEREKNLTEYKIRLQLEKCLESISAELIKKMVIAYEPIWAIGTGVSDSPEKANQAILFIRKFLQEIYDKEVAQSVRILYGGSINPENVQSFIRVSGIDGFLIGKSSLDPDTFYQIINIIDGNSPS